MKIEINITKEIIDESNRLLSEGENITKSCAVALALKPTFPNVAVGGAQIHLGGITGGPKCDTPLDEDMRNFIGAFDLLSNEGRENLVGAHFELDIPDNIIELCNPKNPQ